MPKRQTYTCRGVPVADIQAARARAQDDGTRLEDQIAAWIYLYGLGATCPLCEAKDLAERDRWADHRDTPTR